MAELPPGEQPFLICSFSCLSADDAITESIALDKMLLTNYFASRMVYQTIEIQYPQLHRTSCNWGYYFQEQAISIPKISLTHTFPKHICTCRSSLNQEVQYRKCLNSYFWILLHYTLLSTNEPIHVFIHIILRIHR